MASPSISDLLERAKAAPPEHRDVSVVLDRAIAEQVDALNRRLDELVAERAETAEGFEQQRKDLARDLRMSDPRPAELEKEAKAALEALDAKIDELEGERDALTEGVTITFRFTKLPGQAWSEITSRNPPRPDVGIDRIYSYNYHEAAKEAAAYVDADGTRYGVRILTGEDGAEHLEQLEVDQWIALFPLLAGGEFERIATLLFDMNDWGPRQRAAAAKKA